MAEVKILFYEPSSAKDIAGTVKDWDNAPDGKKCHGVLITTDSEAIVIAPTEFAPRGMATVQYCCTVQNSESKFVWRLPTEADFRLMRRNRRKVNDALASVGDAIKFARYWVQDPNAGELGRLLTRDGSVTKYFENPARVRLVANYKLK